jgi:hypothetical protein
MAADRIGRLRCARAGASARPGVRDRDCAPSPWSPAQRQERPSTPAVSATQILRLTSAWPSSATRRSIHRPVALDVVRSALTDTTFNDAVRVAADVTDDRSLAAVRCGSWTARPARPIGAHFIVVVDSLRPDYLSPHGPCGHVYAGHRGVLTEHRDPPSVHALRRHCAVGAGLWAGGLIPRARYCSHFQ